MKNIVLGKITCSISLLQLHVRGKKGQGGHGAWRDEVRCGSTSTAKRWPTESSGTAVHTSGIEEFGRGDGPTDGLCWANMVNELEKR
jgi:hypothetical protein